MKRRIGIVSTAVAVLSCSLTTQVFANDFTDLDQTEVKSEIEYFDENGYFDIFIDEDPTEFNPNQDVTRGEFAVLFYEILGLDLVDTNGLEPVPFVDINEVEEKYIPYAESCYYNNVVSGEVIDGDIYFSFYEPLSREEMITIIGRYYGSKDSELLSFKDAEDVSKWATEYVSYFYNNDIAETDVEGYFNPKEVVSREEAIDTLYNVEMLVNTQNDNGLEVSNYIGSGLLGYKNGTYEESSFTTINDIAFGVDGSILVADSLSNQIRKADNNTVETVVGVQNEYDFTGLPIGGYIDGDFDEAVLGKPLKLLPYNEDVVLFTEEDSNAIRGYNLDTRAVFTLAGDVEAGYAEDKADDALFNRPTGLAKDSKGNVYVADTLNNVIRKIDTNYNVTLFAGSPKEFGNVNGDIQEAEFNEPTDLFMVDDVLYVADSGNNMIKKIENGTVSVVCGIDTYTNTETETQVGGDRDGSVEVAQLNYPTGIFVDENGVVYIADTENNKIKIVKDGKVQTIAGSGVYGNDLGDALQASFARPSSILVKDDVIYVADAYNQSIKIISRKEGDIDV